MKEKMAAKQAFVSVVFISLANNLPDEVQNRPLKKLYGGGKSLNRGGKMVKNTLIFS